MTLIEAADMILSEADAPPFAWGYFPNAYMQDNWQRYYGERA